MGWDEPSEDGSGFRRSRHVKEMSAFWSQARRKTPGIAHVCPAHSTRNQSVAGLLSFRYVIYFTVLTAGEGREYVDRVAGG